MSLATSECEQLANSADDSTPLAPKQSDDEWPRMDTELLRVLTKAVEELGLDWPAPEEPPTADLMNGSCHSFLPLWKKLSLRTSARLRPSAGRLRLVTPPRPAGPRQRSTPECSPLTTRLPLHSIQCFKCTMASLVVNHLWLNLTEIKDADRTAHLDSSRRRACLAPR